MGHIEEGTDTLRKHRLLGTIAVTAAILVAGCGSTPGSGSAKGSTNQPFQIGIIAPLTGPFAQIGQQVEAGAQIAANQINAKGGVDGHKIKFIAKDEQLSPTQTVLDMRELASAGVQAVIGGTITPDCEAAMPIADQYHMMFISFTCADNVLTTTKFNPNFFEVAPRTDELANAAAQFAHAQFPQIGTWNNMSYDYITGHGYYDSFVQTMKKLQPSVKFGTSIFLPLTATQLRPYITQMVSSAPNSVAAKQGLFLSTYGAGTIALAQQGRSYNLFSRYKAVLDVSGNELISATLGSTGPEIYYVYDYYYKAYHNAMNTAFVNAYMKTNQIGPASFDYQGYTDVQAIVAAAKKAGISNGSKMSKALVGIHFMTPKGMGYFRSDHMLMVPLTVFECKSDAQAPDGFTCPFSKSISPNGVLPPPTH